MRRLASRWLRPTCSPTGWPRPAPVGSAHTELLALLVGDEQTRRDSAGLARRLAGPLRGRLCGGGLRLRLFRRVPDYAAPVSWSIRAVVVFACGARVLLHRNCGSAGGSPHNPEPVVEPSSAQMGGQE